MAIEGNLPIPDPTALTTEHLLREISHLRQLIEERDHRYSQLAQQQQQAVAAALAGVELRSAEKDGNLRGAIDYLGAVTEAKFVTFRTLLDSQAEKVALALNAADKAVAKAEIANEKRFESLLAGTNRLSDQEKNFVTRPEFDGTRASLTEKIDDLKGLALRSEGRGAGLSAGWGYLLGLAGLAITVVGILAAVRR